MKRIAEKVKPASTDDYSGALPSAELDTNIAFFKKIFKKDSVLRLKRISGSGAYNCRCALFYALVVVAGMNYAAYVEAKGYNVLSSAEHLAERELPRMLDKLITNIKRAAE